MNLTSVEVRSLRDSWARSLKAANRAAKTQDVYLSTLDDFERFLRRTGMPVRVDAITREYVEAYLVDLLARLSPATASVRFRALQQFFKWATDEGEITASPMAKAVRPIVPETLPRILSDSELKAILKACEGKGFEDRRDRALLLVFLDTGARLSEVAGITLDDINLDAGIVRVLGKGRRERLTSIGAGTVTALDRYLRLRRAHRHAALPNLWLAMKGPLTPSGIKQVVMRRAKKAGVENVHPHAFRHTMAHRLKAAGASDEVVMSLGGWRSAKIMQSYGRSLASDRALAAHKHLSPVDQLRL